MNYGPKPVFRHVAAPGLNELQALVEQDCLWTLATAVRHELKNTHDRLKENEPSSRVALMARALHLLSAINCLVSTFRDREELLRETCHLIVSVGGYAAAIVASRLPDTAQLQPVTKKNTIPQRQEVRRHQRDEIIAGQSATADPDLSTVVSEQLVPSSRVATRAAFRTVRQHVTGRTPAEAIAKVRKALEHCGDKPRRPSDASADDGTGYRLLRSRHLPPHFDRPNAR